MRVPGAGRLLPWCGGSGVGRSPIHDCPPSGRAAGAHYPLAVGAGGCGRGDPSPTPRRALLGACFARCGDGTRAAGGGASCLGVGRPRSGALPPPTACPLGGLLGPTTHWLWVRGGAGVGTRHQPHSARSCVLWGRHEGARGGRLLPGCGASGVGRSLTPDCPPSGRAAGAHYPLAVGAGGCGRGDPSPTPRRALLGACFARCGDGTRAAGGGASCLGVGRPRSGALPPPTACPLGGLLGPTTHWLWVRGEAAVGTRHQPHSARSCVLWGRHEGARGGRLLPGCGASGVGRSLTPDCPPSGRAAGAHYPLAVGAGGCGRGDPSPTPQRALFGACFARCGDGTRAAGGGASCLGVGRPRSGALPPPTARPLSGLPEPNTHWLWVRGGCGRGDPSPTPQRALLRAGFARCGARTRAPGGGASCLGVGLPGSGALPPPTARPLGGLPGPTTHWLWVRGGAGVGTRHQPHSARSCVLWGWHEGARAGRLLPGCGASGVGRSPIPDCPPSGRAGGAHYPLAVGARGCGRGDPSPTPQRALLRACFARCGGGMRVFGGAPLAWVWGVRGRALSQPRLPALWAGCRGPLPTGCGCGGVRAWGPVTYPTARALACCGGGMRVPRGGAPLAWVLGVRGRALSHPRLPALWAGCRGPLPTGCGCGGVRAWGPVPNPQRVLLRAGFARCGGGMRLPGGGASCLGVGRPGSGALPFPTARPLGGLPLPTTHWLWVRGGAGVGIRHQPHSARSCELALRAAGAA